MVLTLYKAFLRRGLPGSYACGTRLPFALCAICGKCGLPYPDCTIHTLLPGDLTTGCTQGHSPSKGYNFEGLGKMSRGAPCLVNPVPHALWGICPGANSPPNITCEVPRTVL